MDKQIKKTSEIGLQYLLYLPDNYNGSDRFSLMVFLHGAGEKGLNLDKVKKNGIPKLLAQGKDFPFIVIAPQCPITQYWQPRQIKLLLEEVMSEYAIDKERIYLTGISMGGYGTWMTACAYPACLPLLLQSVEVVIHQKPIN